MPDQTIRMEPMTLTQKLQGLVAMSEQGRESDVYAGIEFLLRTRDWPAWLTQTAKDIDFLCTKETAHG